VNWTEQGDSVGFPANPRLAPLSIGSDLINRPDKVGHILNSWKIHFSTVNISVDNFIYRVEALTYQTLEGNFAGLCKNDSLLFDGKARQFYWRFHKTSSEIRWDLLCLALRKQ